MPTLNTEIERQPGTVEKLQAENSELRLRLQEAEETIAAIRSGAVDALVVEEPDGHRVYTLEGADRPYRLFVEEMQQGAATLHADGTIAWCNRQFATLLKMPQAKLLGAALHDFISPGSRATYDNLLWQGQTRSGRGEAYLHRADGGLVPAFLTFNALPKDCGAAIGILVTDLTTQKHHDQLTAAHTALRETEERLATELAAAVRLQEISGRLIREGDVGQLYHEILDAAMSIMRSDMASIQMVDEGQDALRMLAWRGFDPAFAKVFELNRPDTKTSCSVARREGHRVIVPDVERCDFIVGTTALEDHRKTGIRAVQSTPLFSRGGRMLGMISTHWRHPHQPAERDLHLLDVLARQAADVMERKQAEQALRASECRLRAMIDALPVAIYTTDAEGRLTHFNPAAVEFSGRTPELGTDQWCVSFKLFYADGRPMPHDECPMAIALKEGRIIRGVEAIAERPDGTRVWFTPYPTALRDRAGKIVGGINMLLDITERKQAEAALRANEERFRTLFELGPVAVYSCDAAGVIQTFNHRAAELWGRAPAPGDTDERFCGSFKLHRPDGTFMPHEQCPMAEVLAGKIPAIHDAEVIIERPDSSRITVIVNIRPLKDEQGEVTGAINCFHDVTERKQAEEARARLAAIVDSSDDAIISKTLNGVVTSWNSAAERLLGYRAEEIIGQPIVTVIPPDHQDEEKEILARLRRDERVEHFETVRMAKDGRRIEVSLSISPVRDRTGRVIGASKIMRDVTERKQAEEKLRQAQAQLADRAGQLEQAVTERTAELTATNKQLEAFVYSIAHDLRAPLRAMQGFSTMLVEEAGPALSETSRRYANRISKSAQFMDALLMDLLAFSRLSQERIDLMAVNLEAVVTEVLSRLEKEIQGKNAEIEVVEPLPTVLAHEPMLAQVVFNLVSNALKFVLPGVPPLIRLRAEEQGGFVRVWVEDNGIGIATEHQEQIFRLFNRLHGESYEGTGIGLAVVQKGVERMGGRVGVESAPGQGSRFWFELRTA